MAVMPRSLHMKQPCLLKRQPSLLLHQVNMDKDSYYWKLHKEIWAEEFDKLANSIQQQILSDPGSPESSLLNRRIDKLIGEILLKKIP